MLGEEMGARSKKVTVKGEKVYYNGQCGHWQAHLIARRIRESIPCSGCQRPSLVLVPLDR